jgi:hypothetical protein
MQTANSASKPDGNREKDVHIFVDGEREDLHVSSLTPRQIITDLAKRDAANYYLVQIHGKDRVSYQDHPDDPIELTNGMHFQTVLSGATPVSDGALLGPAAFAHGLAEAGYTVTVLSSHPDHLYFDYVVSSGTKAGTTVKIGVIVPQDFPEVPPGGPHVSPHVFPINTGGSHPYGAIHESADFSGPLGEPWQYWSRPFRDWSSGRKTVAAYLSHIWRLWDSQ